MTGRLLDMEPEDREPVAFVMFEPLGDVDDMPAEPGSDRIAWHIRALDDVGRACHVNQSDIEGACALVRAPSNETAAWDLMADLLTRAGFDVYNADTRFEAYACPNPASSVSCG